MPRPRRLLDPAARGRTGRAKAAVLVGGAALFAGGFALARASHPSQEKHPVKPLEAPAGFVRQVEQHGQLSGGVIAPSNAPPVAQTAAS
jgi:hypothetical protein